MAALHHVDSALTLANGTQPRYSTAFNGSLPEFVDVQLVDAVLDAPTLIHPGASAKIRISLVADERKYVLKPAPDETTVTCSAGSCGIPGSLWPAT